MQNNNVNSVHVERDLNQLIVTTFFIQNAPPTQQEDSPVIGPSATIFWLMSGS